MRYFDVSDRIALNLKGPDAADLLQRISTNDMRSLQADRHRQTVLTTEKGRIVDFVSVVSRPGDELLLVGQSTDPSLLEPWINKFIIMEDARVVRLQDLFHLLLYGYGRDSERSAPMETVFAWCDEVAGLVYFEEKWPLTRILHILGPVALLADVTERLTGLTGAQAATPAEFDLFRVQHIVPCSPNELSERFNPLEAGLVGSVSFTKGCYVGQEVVARLDTYNKVQRRLARLDFGAPDVHLPAILRDAEGVAGTVTTLAREGGSGKQIGLGYVRSAALESAKEVACFPEGATGPVPVRITLS